MVLQQSILWGVIIKRPFSLKWLKKHFLTFCWVSLIPHWGICGSDSYIPARLLVHIIYIYVYARVRIKQILVVLYSSLVQSKFTETKLLCIGLEKMGGNSEGCIGHQQALSWLLLMMMMTVHTTRIQSNLLKPIKKWLWKMFSFRNVFSLWETLARQVHVSGCNELYVLVIMQNLHFISMSWCFMFQCKMLYVSLTQ